MRKPTGTPAIHGGEDVSYRGERPGTTSPGQPPGFFVGIAPRRAVFQAMKKPVMKDVTSAADNPAIRELSIMLITVIILNQFYERLAYRIKTIRDPDNRAE